MKTSVAEKAVKYLSEGKVQVVTHDERSARLTVQGSQPHAYEVEFNNFGWSCDCPAYTDCAHIEAAKLISPLRYHRPTSFAQPSKFDDLFA